MRRAAGMGLWLLSWLVGALALTVLVLTVPFAWLGDYLNNAADSIAVRSKRIERGAR